ncbi:PAS domain S-box protein [Nocardioides silvaticus]|uniref:PAS domain S-box protein n=1 Tax=Nocardioides silvaticus TaxID=2201891 RepID=A0A316TLZ2_9ACTN|nr:PAS domain S-box protein [Nocardioides silvaticus]
MINHATERSDVTETREPEPTEETEHERRLRLIIEAAPNAMVMIDGSGRIVLVNSEAEQSFGYDRRELLSMRVEQLMPTRFRDRHALDRTAYVEEPARRAMGAGRELFGLRSDGTEMPIEIGLNPISIGDEQFVLASVIDITERLDARAVEQDTLRRTIFDSIPFSIIATDAEGVVVTANPGAEQLLGYRQAELVGRRLDHIDAAIDHSRAEPTSLRLRAGTEREWEYRRRDGTVVPVHEATTRLQDESGTTTGYLVVAYDISKRIQAQAAVLHMANHDALTDMPNRSLLVSRLRTAIVEAQAGGTELAVLLLDLDHFKRVNDLLGHHAGDDLLLRTAERLNSWGRRSDIIARLGGDEFVVVLERLGDRSQVSARIQSLLETVMQPVDLGGQEVAVTVSIGAAVYPVDGIDPTALLKHADTAMYQAKAAGRNNVRWFHRSMLDETNDRVSLTSALRQALAAGELSLDYQPQVDLATGEVTGFEALARWHSAEHGAVGPDRFIPVAEDSGMIVPLGGWVLRQACRDMVEIQRALGRPFHLAVNVSPRQVHSSGWLDEIVDALKSSGLDASQLELEITEGILMDERWGVTGILQAIRDLGVKIVIDDFGRGYSSLAYLTRFPIDKLKIDRSFVHDLGGEDPQAPIVDAIIVMAHALGLTVVAEGVESPRQITYLRQRDCDEAQGYYFSPGVSADEVLRTVRRVETR